LDQAQSRCNHLAAQIRQTQSTSRASLERASDQFRRERDELAKVLEEQRHAEERHLEDLKHSQRAAEHQLQVQLAQKIGEYDRKALQLVQGVKHLEHALEEERKSRRQVENRAETLTQELASMHRENDKLETALVEAQRSRERERHDVARLVDERDAALEREQQAKAELQQTAKHNTVLRDQLTNMSAANGNLKDQCRRLVHAIEQDRQDNTHLRRDNAALQDQLANERRALHDAKQRVAQLEAQMAQARESNDHLKRCLSQATSDLEASEENNRQANAYIVQIRSDLHTALAENDRIRGARDLALLSIAAEKTRSLQLSGNVQALQTEMARGAQPRLYPRSAAPTFSSSGDLSHASDGRHNPSLLAMPNRINSQLAHMPNWV